MHHSLCMYFKVQTEVWVNAQINYTSALLCVHMYLENVDQLSCGLWTGDAHLEAYQLSCIVIPYLNMPTPTSTTMHSSTHLPAMGRFYPYSPCRMGSNDGFLAYTNMCGSLWGAKEEGKHLCPGVHSSRHLLYFWIPYSLWSAWKLAQVKRCACYF